VRFLSLLAYLIVRLLNATLRVRQVRPEHIDGTPQYILAFWHDQLVPLMGSSRWRRPITVMISQSKDGEIVAGVLRLYGVESARGSSTRGGTGALREMLREARAGKSIVFTPDGPRGPSRIAKEGVAYAAQVTALPIMPMAFAARKKKLLRSWDRMLIPLPFSKGVCVYGAPMVVPRDGDAEEWRLKIEQTLNELTAEAERLIGEPGKS
jgi:lysophospholipid acyltransferase (LPLAT)-like uncharacterized protein